MNWEAIGAVGEILGAIAVVLTLIYLARQIGENNRQGMNAESHHFIDEINRLHEVTLNNPNHAELLHKLVVGADLSVEEKVRAIAFSKRLTNHWRGGAIAYELGQISERYYQGALCADVKDVVNEMPYLVRYLKANVSEESSTEIFRPILEASVPERYPKH